MQQSKEMHHTMRRIYDVFGLSKPSEVAAKLNVAPSVVSNWQKRGISKDAAVTIQKDLGVSAMWILEGDGDIYVNGAERRTDDGMTVEQLDPRPVVEWDGETPLDKDEISVPFFKDFPVSCGTGTIGEAVLENEHRRLRLSKATINAYGVDPDAVIVVTAHGNSNSPIIMNKAAIHLELRRQDVSEITDGCFYAICHDGAHFFKKLYRLPGGGVRVVSENRDEYPEYSLSKERIADEHFTIEGYAFDVQNPLPRR